MNKLKYKCFINGKHVATFFNEKDLNEYIEFVVVYSGLSVVVKEEY